MSYYNKEQLNEILNYWDKISEDFERKWEADDWFSDEVVAPLPMEQQGQSQVEEDLGQSRPQQPSVNSLVNQT